MTIHAHGTAMRNAFMLGLLLGATPAAALTPPAPPPAWHDGLDWDGVHVSMQKQADGGYTLAWPFGERTIPAEPLRSETASPLFDGLFAMAQDDLARDSVTAIRDGAFDHGQPIPCHCFETGLKWPYVWTRDLSYSIDLGLWRFDPLRARNGLKFKLSSVREASAPQGLYVMQDTGSGGSWPISTDRVVWFLGARHLLDDKPFAADVYTALRDTLAQDRQYAFDDAMGLYRGETSFLDWREQTYPAWTANQVVPIGQSFALSTNVLHYQALQLAAKLAAARRDDPASANYAKQAAALKAAINARFWRDDRGLYMSYIGGDGTPYDSYDLLGIALAVTSGVAEGDRAKRTLADYPAWAAGSPVIWPERADQPIYHNRAIWPFVSAYAMRAARAVNDPARIAHEIRSILRGAALSGSNMENYELLTQQIHVDLRELSGPVVNSPRQLWSVAAYFAVVTEGVFGLTPDDRIEPKLPISLVPTLFGDRRDIALHLADRDITLQLPARFNAYYDDTHLLVADRIVTHGKASVVTLKAVRVAAAPLRMNAPLHAPEAPPAPTVRIIRDGLAVHADGKVMLYANGRRMRQIDGDAVLPWREGYVCLSATRVDAHGLESLHSPGTCIGDTAQVGGDWPRHWSAPTTGDYRVWLDYDNRHGPINTGITAAVKMLRIECGDAAAQRVALILPHSIARQASTWGRFHAKAGDACRFALEDGFNMSYLAHFAHYTGGEGGASGPLNAADIGELVIVAEPQGCSGRACLSSFRTPPSGDPESTTYGAASGGFRVPAAPAPE
jgi:hypothetical protein